MARFECKIMKRHYNRDTGRDIFVPDRGDSVDLSGLRFLSAGVDTIRQLFNCYIRQDVVSCIDEHREHSSDNIINFAGIDWMFSSSGKKSGYQYIFKNLDLGVVVLVKSFTSKIDEHGPHLKIEVTPQLIDQLGLSGVSCRIREIARLFAETLEASGVAVHLYADMKGLDIPDDFEQRLACRSKRSFKANGISSFDVSSSAFVYGMRETFMFGQSSSLQMCLYNKTNECIKSDKIDFMNEVWSRTPSLADPFKSEYNDGHDTGESDVVHRLEFRIHQKVIREFELGHYQKSCTYDDDGNVVSEGNFICIRESRDLKKHLQGLWNYCINNFRLEYSRTYVDPIWQKISEDVRFFDIHPTFIYARSQKKTGGVPTRRNVAMWLGNYLRLASRRGFFPSIVVDSILSSGFDSELCDYFGLLSFGESDLLHAVLTDFVTERMTRHRLNGVAA